MIRRRQDQRARSGGSPKPGRFHDDLAEARRTNDLLRAGWRLDERWKLKHDTCQEADQSLTIAARVPSFGTAGAPT